MKNTLLKLKFTTALLLVFAISLFFVFCKNSNEKTAAIAMNNYYQSEKSDFLFNLQVPDKIIKLGLELNEISSIAYYKDSLLLCVQDENANIYIFDFQKEQIAERILSFETGDYEGIELAGSAVYLLKSSGTLLEFQNFKISGLESKHKYKTALSSKNDTEGLGFDKKTNSLLIACKNKPYLSEEFKTEENIRTIYRFDLNTKTLIEKPFLTLNLNELYQKYRIEKFMPSGIAIHPQTDDIYIISAVGNYLIAVDKTGAIIHAEQLLHKMFKQPEGICFSPDGKKLFISNEGKDKKANILIFNSK